MMVNQKENNELERQMLEMIDKDDLESFKNIVPSKIPLHWQTNYGNTLLYTACADGAQRIMAYLISFGVDIHQSNKSDISPFLISVCRGHLKISKRLIEMGADVNKKPRGDEEELCDYLSINNSSYDISDVPLKEKLAFVDYLLEHSTSLNEKNKKKLKAIRLELLFE